MPSVASIVLLLEVAPLLTCFLGTIVDVVEAFLGRFLDFRDRS